MKLLKKLVSTILALITAYFAALGLVSLAKDLGNYLANRKA